MHSENIKYLSRWLLIIIVILSSAKRGAGQEVPAFPVSYRIFSPFIFNPAITGSKDFTSVDIILGRQGTSNSQLICANSRLIKKGPAYFMSPYNIKFSNFGLGGYLFDERISSSRSIGFGAMGSYQVPLDQKLLSFFSIGAAVKGVYNIMDSTGSSDPLPGNPEKKIFYPNFDLGIYFYGPRVFAGLSATNLLGNPENPDSLGVYRLPDARRFNVIAGYKFVLSNSLDIILEPSLLMNFSESLDQKPSDYLRPMLKLYMQGFCVGTYFNNFDNIPFFFQFKYPKFFVGAYCEMPRNTPYYKKDINIEITFGINFSVIKNRDSEHYQW